MDVTASDPSERDLPLGAAMPEGIRFVGVASGRAPGWRPGDAPSDDDLARCVACGLCLPHCPTYRMTGEESASPRGRLAAMRTIADGGVGLDPTFVSFMDLCLACRACEDVCPSHVPFGRMMERARVQVEPLRPRRRRLVGWLGLDVLLPRNRLLTLAARFQGVGLAFASKRTRSLVPKATLGDRVPVLTEPEGSARGTVALLTGCVQDRWFRPVNRATVRVLARNGWRVVVPRDQRCCGALQAHHGRLDTARDLARRNLRAFADADVVLANAAGCGAHLREVGDLLETNEARGFATRVRDVLAFLDDEGIERPAAIPDLGPVAYHDACHALRAQGIHDQPRRLLREIPGLEIVEIPHGDRCCGAAGLFTILEPATSDELMRGKAEAIASTGARVIASANPGCTVQIAAGLRALGHEAEVVHPVELLDRAYAAADL